VDFARKKLAGFSSGTRIWILRGSGWKVKVLWGEGPTRDQQEKHKRSGHTSFYGSITDQSLRGIMDIRNLRAKDLPEYLSKLRQQFPGEVVEDEEVWEISKKWTVKLLLDEGIPIGGAHWAPLQRKGIPFIGMDHVWVSEQVRGKGVALKFVQAILQEAREAVPGADCVFDTIEETPTRLGFWRKLGVKVLTAPMRLILEGQVKGGMMASIIPLTPFVPWSSEFYLATVEAYLRATMNGSYTKEAVEELRGICPSTVGLRDL
jgi:predicted GNAT family acetyltransferase